MRKRAPTWLVPALLAAALAAAGAARALAQSGATGEGGDEAVRWKEIAGGKAKIQFYGFLRLDAIVDDSRPDSSQTPFFILPEDPNLGPAEQNDFTLHPRLTRLGLNVRGPAIAGLGGAAPSGNLEMDFQNGGRESRPIIRIRHAWFRFSWKTLSLLGGQTWDLFSPLVPTVNNDSLMWNAGNLGDRRPQVRLSWDPEAGPGTLSVAGAAGLTGAVDPRDLDGDGVRDGETSGRPNAQARVGWGRALSGDRKLAVGVSGLYAWEKTARPVPAGGRDTRRTRALGLDVRLPFHARVALAGEAWTGRNLSDFRGGAGQGIRCRPSTCEEIDSRGGWAELTLRAGRSVTFHPGYTIDNPREDDEPTGGSTAAAAGRSRNRAWYVAGRYQPDPSFLAGLDYLRWITDFQGFERGLDNRVNVYLQYNF
jgi:hypothetical protein